VLVQDRMREITQRIAHLAQDILVLRLTEETLRLTIVLNDATTLRIIERWQGNHLTRYSYYWLDAQDETKVGWDNAPHHTQLPNFPHHKHIGVQGKLCASDEVCLEDIIPLLEQEITR